MALWILANPNDPGRSFRIDGSGYSSGNRCFNSARKRKNMAMDHSERTCADHFSICMDFVSSWADVLSYIQKSMSSWRFNHNTRPNLVNSVRSV